MVLCNRSFMAKVTIASYSFERNSSAESDFGWSDVILAFSILLLAWMIQLASYGILLFCGEVWLLYLASILAALKNSEIK